MEEKESNENVHSFEVKVQSGRRKGPWKVTLEPDVLTLSACESTEQHQISKAQAWEKVEFFGAFLKNKFLSVKIPKAQLFEITPEQETLIKEWLGPPTIKDMKLALKKRLKWSLPLGIMFIFISLPMSARPEAGLEAIPLDLFGIILGVVLVGLSIVMRFWPRRELFLVNSAWFLVGIVKITYDIITGANWLWSIFLLLLLISVIDGFKQYRRFEQLELQRSDVESQLRLD